MRRCLQLLFFWGFQISYAGTLYDWISTSSTVWNQNTNWSPNTGFPGSVGTSDVANFSSSPSFTQQTVIPSTPVSIAGIGCIDVTISIGTLGGSTISFFGTPTPGGTPTLAVLGLSASPSMTVNCNLDYSAATSGLVSSLLSVEPSTLTLNGSLIGTTDFSIQPDSLGGVLTTIFSGSNSFSGAAINVGFAHAILQVNNANALGGASLCQFDATTFQIGPQVNSATFSTPFTIGGLTGGGATSTLTVDSQSFTATLSGIIQNAGGVTGSLTKIGSGTLILTGANTYTGTTNVNGGTLQGSVASFPTNIVTAASTTTVFAQGSTSATFANTITGSGAVQVSGSSISTTLTFSNTGNNYSGGTEIISGTLKGLSSPAMTIPGNVQVDSGANLYFSVTAGGGSFPGLISGGGSLTVAGTNAAFVFTVSNASNSYTGGTVIGLSGSPVTLLVPANGCLGISGLVQGPVAINNLSTLQVGASFTIARAVSLTGSTTIDTQGNILTLQGQMTDGSSSGILNKIGSGILSMLTVTPASPVLNTYTGGTVVQAGTLQGDTNTLPASGGIQVASTPTLLAFNQSFQGTYGGVISNYGGGQGPVLIEGGGTVIFTGANTYSGGTTVGFIGAATLQGFVQPTGSSLQGAFVLTNTSSNLIFNQGTAGTYTAAGPVAISGAGNIVVQAGSLTLVGANTYTGTTTIQKSGTLSIANYNSINSGNLIFNQGTLALTSAMTITGTVALNGPGTINNSSNSNTISGVISGSSSLSVAGGGTLTLTTTTTNLYGGGTQIQSGTIVIGSSLSIPSSGGIQLASGATVNFNQSTTGTYSGLIQNLPASSITGGALLKTNTGTLILTGTNSYAGGTTVSAGTLQGTTTSLQGAILDQAGATLSFNQATTGTYAGVLSGPGSLTIAGGGTIIFSGASPLFTGATQVSTAGTVFNVTGNVSASAIAVSSGASLSGTGSVGSVSNAGTIVPGVSGVGTLTVVGAGGVQFLAGSSFTANVEGASSGLLQISAGTANIDPTATINVNIVTPFVGFSQEYILINASSPLSGGHFVSPPNVTPGFVATISYTTTQVLLSLRSLTPFSAFSFANANERSVGQNLDALSSAGEVSTDLANVLNTFLNQSISVINDALDQMHPAATSALSQMQVELGGQFLSLLHGRDLACGCRRKNQVWVEPFGNWLHVKQQGMEIGFTTTTRGVVLGYEREFFGFWTVGCAGSYAATDLKWALDRGYCYIKNFFGALYSDWALDRFRLGFSAYGGKDWYTRARHMAFTTIDRQAISHSDGLETGAQLHMAYNLGRSNFALYPYAQVDYLYLSNDKFAERGAMALDLTVSSYTSSTLRVETGGAFRLIDQNRARTICISPFISFGYVWERPLHRSTYHSKFAGVTIPFTTWGWNQIWQLLDLKVGLTLVYRCFTLDSEYIIDMSPKGASPLVNQRANFRMSYNF